MSVQEVSLAELRAAGRAHVRRRLEELVNLDIIGVAGAQKAYRDAFGGELKAVRGRKLIRFFGWLWLKTLGSQSRDSEKEGA